MITHPNDTTSPSSHSMVHLDFEILRAEIVVSSLLKIGRNSVDYEEYEEEIKKRLTLEIADKLMKSNFMLFTKEHKPDSYDMIFRARCCISHKNNIKVFLKNGM